MAEKIVLLDTSILIEYYRKTNKANSTWIGLIDQGHEFVISAITKYELYSGATQNQMEFWDSIMSTISIISFNEACVDTAVNINAVLKQKRKQIDIADLFIAATEVTYDFPIATLNKKHFERIDQLLIIE